MMRSQKAGGIGIAAKEIGESRVAARTVAEKLISNAGPKVEDFYFEAEPTRVKNPRVALRSSHKANCSPLAVASQPRLARKTLDLAEVAERFP